MDEALTSLAFYSSSPSKFPSKVIINRRWPFSYTPGNIHLGGQTPLLSTVELYDRLVAELPGFVETLAQKGVPGFTVDLTFKSHLNSSFRYHGPSVLPYQGRPRGEDNRLELAGLIWIRHSSRRLARDSAAQGRGRPQGTARGRGRLAA
jgi:hypothetical protein